jgi:hypothetical protein
MAGITKHVAPAARDRGEQAQADTSDAIRRQLRASAGLPERTVSATVPAASSLVVVHRLGRIPKGIAVERCDLGGPVTLAARTAETITLANAHATDAAACVVRVY